MAWPHWSSGSSSVKEEVGLNDHKVLSRSEHFNMLLVNYLHAHVPAKVLALHPLGARTTTRHNPVGVKQVPTGASS